MFGSFFSGTPTTTDPLLNIPKIESTITNVSGFDHLDIIIKEGDIIKTRAECQIVLDKSLKVEADMGGKGVISGLWRSMSTGTIFMNKISYGSSETTSTTAPQSVSGEIVETKGGAPSQGKLSIYSIIPGNIKEIVIEPSGVWCIHNNSFLACTDNINLTSGLSLSTIVTGNGLFYTKVENTSSVNGKVWLTAYGGIIERPLKDNRDFLVHSGLFLAMKNGVYEKISVNKAGSFFTAVAGGEGIMMDFSKTDTDDILYLQSGNLDSFLDFIAGSMPSNNMGLPIDAIASTDGDISLVSPEGESTIEDTTPVVSPSQMNEPPPTQMNEPPPTQMNEPLIQMNQPSSVSPPTQMNEPSVSPPPTQMNQLPTQTNQPPSVSPTSVDTAVPTVTPVEIGGKRFRKTKSKYYKKGRKTRRR